MSQHDEPRFSLSPWAVGALSLLAASAWTWRGAPSAAPPAAPPSVPAAAPRSVAPRADLTPSERSTIGLFERASPSVVNIANIEVRRSSNRFSMNETAIPRGSGTGFVWDERGHIVTTFHVIQNASAIVVTLADRSEWPAKVVGVAPDFDLSVVRIDAPEELLPPLPVGGSRDLLVGQDVFAIGNPFGLDQTLTRGIISGLDREIYTITQRRIEGVIQTDAAINPGNSGGPLLDSSGRLIGVNTAIYSPSGASAGIGFAVPVDTINRVVPELITSGRFVRPVLGVQMMPDSVVRDMRIAGVLVRSVVPGSGAAHAGLRDLEVNRDGSVEGDLIVAIEGAAVRDSNDLLHLLAQHEVGDVVRLAYMRGGERREVEVRLQSID
jgi:S1-C subfamily serine protease